MEVLKTALPYIISGISVGGQYALIAIGYTMVYGILRLINFAHGDVFMVAGLMMVYFATWMPLYLAIPLMIMLTVLLGFLIERVAYKPLRTAPRMSVMISAIGVSYLIQNLALYVTGGLNKNYPAIPWISDPVRLFGMETSRVTVITPFLTIALVIALVLLINHTKIGMAMRAVSVDFETAQLMGINLAKHKMISFVVSSFFAGVSGATMAMVLSIAQANNYKVAMTYEILLMVVLGGIGSISGSVIGSMLFVAASEWWLRGLDSGEFLGIKAPEVFRNGFRLVVFSIVIMVVVLFFRKGIMGDRELPQVIAVWKAKLRAKKAAKQEVTSK